MVTPANYVIALAGFVLHGASGVGTLGFLQHFLPNASDDQEKMSFDLSAGLLALCHM